MNYYKKIAFGLLITCLTGCSFFLNNKSPNSRDIASDLSDANYDNSFKSFPKSTSYPYLSIREDLGEYLIKGEKKAVEIAAESIEATIMKRAKKGVRGRGDHSTSQGCYQAKLTVLKGIPDNLSAGITAKDNQGKVLNAVIRFSNSEPRTTKDIHSASLGIAVKTFLNDQRDNHSDFLLGQWQPQLREQDFLAGTSKKFMAKNIIGYSELFAARVKPGLKDVGTIVKNSKTIFDRGVTPRLRMKGNAPLIIEKRFWSSLPYAWGDEAAKFSFKPCHYVDRKSIDFNHKEERYQRKVMKSYLENQNLCYEMVLQLRPRENEYREKVLNKYYPIEDASVFWPDGLSKVKTRSRPRRIVKSEFHNIARLVIEKNSLPLPKEVCEKLVFNPWNGLSDHQPLGSLSRGRLSVYLKSKETRYKLNHQ